MHITINKKDVDLNFGVRFVRELDKIAGMSVNVQGIKQNFGFALPKVIPGLQGYDPAILSTVLYAAAYDNDHRPSQREIDDFIDDPHTDIEKLFDEVLPEMKKANAVKVAVKNLKA